MNASAASLMVCVDNPVVCVKIAGRANFTSSVDFKALVNELWQQGRRYFALDLTECLIMDSTFLGVLAGIGVKLADEPQTSGCPHMVLINPNARIADLLDGLGVAQLFKVITSAGPATGNFAAPAATSGPPDHDEISRTCLEAHQILMRLNPENVPKFKEVAEFLAEKLKKAPPESGKPL